MYGTQECFYLCNIHFVWILYIQISTNVALVVTPVTPTPLASTLRVPMIVSVTKNLLEMVSIVSRFFFYLFDYLYFVWVWYMQISTNVTLGITPVTPTPLATTLRVPMNVSVTRDLLERV